MMIRGFDPAAGGVILAAKSPRNVVFRGEAKIPILSVLTDWEFDAASRLTPPAAWFTPVCQKKANIEQGIMNDEGRKNKKTHHSIIQGSNPFFSVVSVRSVVKK